MKLSQMNPYLDMLANAATVVIGLAVSISVLHHFGRTIDRPTPGFQVGAAFPHLPDVSYSKQKLTVAIFVNTHCVTCRTSVDQFEALRQAAQSADGDVLVCAVFSGESSEAIAQFGFRATALSVSDFAHYGVSGTPTIVATDRTGKLRDFWIGKLTSNAQASLERLMKGEG